MTEAAMSQERKRLLLRLYRRLCPDEEPLGALMEDPRGDDIAREMEHVATAQNEQEAVRAILYWNPIGQENWKEQGALQWARRYRALLAKEAVPTPVEKRGDSEPPGSQVAVCDGSSEPLKERTAMDKAGKKGNVPSLFSADQIEERPAPPLSETGAVYIGLAYWASGGWWKIKPEGLWTDVEALRKRLDGLASGWTHRRIYRLSEVK